MQKKQKRISAKTLRTIGLGIFCAIGAFGMGIETAGDLHPFAHSEAALQELMFDGTPLRGDVNGNGRLDVDDADILYQIATGLIPGSPDAIRRGDTDGDLRITSKDLGYVLHQLSQQ